MNDLRHFGSRRSRGVIWVCDIASSSSYLNDNSTAGALEEFLPRLFIVANYITAAAGGKFIKWTGDGFLAWFETPLHRDLEGMAESAFWAAHDLTMMVNVTGLGVKTQRQFRIRHGLSYEHDALVLNIEHSDGHVSIDLIGRGVVLANRLASIEANYPNIVTNKELITAGGRFASYKARPISKEDRLKYFKGEKRGTDDIYVSTYKNSPAKNIDSVIRKGERAIKFSEAPEDKSSPQYKRSLALVTSMLNGPAWCKEVILEQDRFFHEDLKGTLKKVLDLLRDSKTHGEDGSAQNP